MKNLDQPIIIVTGAAGFIGSAVIRHLNDQGIKNIVAVDELKSSEKWKNLVGKEILDLLEKDQLFSFLEGKHSLIKAFIHLGACSSTVETNASYLLENNYRYTLKLAEYALKHHLRFIYASSAATYGDGQLGFSDDEEQLSELKPLNMYGFSKHLFDLWAKNQGVLDQLTGLKYFNVFGPNEAHKGRMASAIYHFHHIAKKTGVVHLFKSDDKLNFSDGEQKRDFIYVKDAAKMTCAFLNNKAGGIYNIGSGTATSWNTLSLSVFKALDLQPSIEYVDMPPDLVGKYQNYTCAKMDKTIDLLQASAKCMPFSEAVHDYIKKHLLTNTLW